jgi:hypothetical protein
MHMAPYGLGNALLECQQRRHAREYVELRIQDLAIHNWDIRAAFEPAPHLALESLPILVHMAPTWLGMSLRPGPRLAVPVIY